MKWNSIKIIQHTNGVQKYAKLIFGTNEDLILALDYNSKSFLKCTVQFLTFISDQSLISRKAWIVEWKLNLHKVWNQFNQNLTLSAWIYNCLSTFEPIRGGVLNDNDWISR